MNLTLGPRNLFIILAVVLFLVGLILWITADPVEAKTHNVILFGGLASFAAGFLWP